MYRLRTVSIVSVILGIVVPIVLGGPVAASQPPRPSANASLHCTVMLAADALKPSTSIAGVAIQDARVAETRCFATFAEALEYGSRGGLRVSADLRPNELTESMVASASSTSTSYLLGINYDCKSYWTGGSCSSSWLHFASSGCTSTSGWQISALGWPEANNVESSKGYSGCNQTRHWEHPSFAGANLLCLPNCSTLGVLNNQTDSIRWWG